MLPALQVRGLHELLLSLAGLGAWASEHRREGAGRGLAVYFAAAAVEDGRVSAHVQQRSL